MDAGVDPLGSELAGRSKDSGGRLRIFAEFKSKREIEFRGGTVRGIKRIFGQSRASPIP
jgi:hypothetical protein